MIQQVKVPTAKPEGPHDWREERDPGSGPLTSVCSLMHTPPHMLSKEIQMQLKNLSKGKECGEQGLGGP